jgi:hypothetical protein
MASSYITDIAEFAFRKSYDGLDRLATIAGLAVPAVYYFAGKPMPETVGGQIAAFVLCALAAITVLRFLSAPYFVWREQQAKIAALSESPNEPTRLLLSHMSQRDAKDLSKFLDVVIAIEEDFWRGDIKPQLAWQLFSTDKATRALSALAHHEPIVECWNRYKGATEYHGKLHLELNIDPAKRQDNQEFYRRFDKSTMEQRGAFKDLIKAIKNPRV